jgi:hypothetical protein
MRIAIVSGSYQNCQKCGISRQTLEEGGSVLDKETREGWPLLTVETQVNGNSKSTMKGVLPWLVR